MNFVKITTIVLILFAGIAGSYIIVKNSLPKIELSGKKENISKSIDSIVKNPIQWIKAAISSDIVNNTSRDYLSSLGDGLNKESTNKDLNSQNLTEFVSQLIFTQMKDLDQKGIDVSSGFDPKSQEGQELIKKTIDSISNPSLLIENYPINDKDMKISLDNSSFKKTIYLEATGKIIYDNSNSLYKNPIKVLERLIFGDISNANKLADTYKNIFNGFLNTEVPSDWLYLHKRYLILLKKFENLYRGLTVFKQDPIKADLLVQMIPDMASDEFKIQQEYFEKEKILGI